jgi:hypothetical protein
MDNGFISLHRKIEDNPIFQDSELFHLFICLLLDANHEKKRLLQNGQEIWIERGQVKTGQHLLALKTSIPRGNVWRKLQTLQNLGIVSIVPSSKFSIITIVKYEDYQNVWNKSSSRLSSKRVASEYQVSTNNNDNNEINNMPTARFDSKEYITQLLNDPKRHIRIIGLYYQFKGYEFPALDAARYSVKRDLKGASELVGYGDEKLLQTMNYLVSLVNKNKLQKWTLETIAKYINEL